MHQRTIEYLELRVFTVEFFSGYLVWVIMPEKEQKKVDPEAALKASVARDIKLRVMDDAIRTQRLHLSYAVWNNQLGEKDLRAEKKRAMENFNQDSQLTNQNVKQIRKQKLEALFYDDELKYEEELAMRGLAYRRIRD